jgi:hypothetical protein
MVLAFCFILEMLVFNAQHFSSVWNDGEISIKELPESDIELLNVERNRENGNFTIHYDEGAQLNINNLSSRITSVYIDFDFPERETTSRYDIRIGYADREHSNRIAKPFQVLCKVENTKYMKLQSYGEVSALRIMFPDETSGIQIKDIVLNKTFPYKFMWGRYALYSLTIFAAVFIVRNKLFSLPLKRNSFKQMILFTGVAVSLVLGLFALVSLASPYLYDFSLDHKDQFNKHMVDAIVAGQAHLTIEPGAGLALLDNPFDWHERTSTETGEGGGWDLVYYDGKFYSYFGIVQVLLISLPFHLITGNYISTRFVVFLFASGAAVFLMLIWRQLVFKFMSKMSVGMFTLGQITIVMCSMLTFVAARPLFYEVAVTSALFFVALGLWLLLRYSLEKRRIVSLFFGCLCMALSVGCRPNYLFFSLLVPVILFHPIKKLWCDKARKKRLVVTIIAAAVPYAAIGSALMWYNYIRFGSVIDFGNSYMLTVTNVGAAGLLNPLDRLILTGACFVAFFVPALNFSTGFPFVSIDGGSVQISETFSGALYKEHVLGVLSMPVVWALAGIVYVFKYNNNHADRKRKSIAGLIAAMPIIGGIQIITISFIGVATRYQLDFVWLFVLTGLICGYYLVESIENTCGAVYLPSINLAAMARRVYCGGMMLSIILMFLLTWSSSDGNWIVNHNLEAYYKFRELLGMV